MTKFCLSTLLADIIHDVRDIRLIMRESSMMLLPWH